jgi:hypothetical protein
MEMTRDFRIKLSLSTQLGLVQVPVTESTAEVF